MKVLTGLMSQPSSISPVLANSKHWDLFLVTRTYNGRPEKVQGVLVGASFELKPGREQQFSEIVRGKIVPLLDKLVSDGTILSYSVERQEIIKEKSNLITFVYIAPDASGIDKVDAALENEIGKDPAFGPAFDAAVKSGVEHDFLSRIVYINYK